MTIACNMNVLNRDERERHKVLTEKLSVSAAELSAGYELVIATETFSLVELAEWISLESRCCPFLNFEVALRLTDSDRVRRPLSDRIPGV